MGSAPVHSNSMSGGGRREGGRQAWWGAAVLESNRVQAVTCRLNRWKRKSVAETLTGLAVAPPYAHTSTRRRTHPVGLRNREREYEEKKQHWIKPAREKKREHTHTQDST